MSEKPTPKLTEISINYSVGVKANLGNFESANVNISKSERWSVEGLSEEEATKFWHERYTVLHKELGELIEQEYKEISS